MFLFSVGDESGELNVLDGTREVCGHVSGREVKEDFPNVRYGVQEDLGARDRDGEDSFLVVRHGFCRTFNFAERELSICEYV